MWQVISKPNVDGKIILKQILNKFEKRYGFLAQDRNQWRLLWEHQCFFWFHMWLEILEGLSNYGVSERNEVHGLNWFVSYKL
jgi:hypothetical protein